MEFEDRDWTRSEILGFFFYFSICLKFVYSIILRAQKNLRDVFRCPGTIHKFFGITRARCAERLIRKNKSLGKSGKWRSEKETVKTKDKGGTLSI